MPPLLPLFAPFPPASWRQRLTAKEWDSLLEAWLALGQACVALPDADLTAKAADDKSLPEFLASFIDGVAESGPSCLGSHATPLLRVTFQLCSRISTLNPSVLPANFEFLCGLSTVYPKKHATLVVARLIAANGTAADASLTSLKKLLIPHLDAGIKGDLRLVESRLFRLNHLLHVSPHACTLFLAGSDFLDGLVTCFRVMNPPLRRIIVTTVYLCLVGIVEAEPPKWAMMNDQLYSLTSSAQAHKAGPIGANDSLVPELVSSTPILKVLSRRAESSGSMTENFRQRISALQEFRRGPMVRPKRLVKRKLDKGKGKLQAADVQAELQERKMDQIAQVRDIFPDIGAGFVSRCLDEYDGDAEQVVANLLSETLPPHLASADRSEPLRSSEHTEPSSHHQPPQVPSRRNVYDDDDFDRLHMDMSKISFGKAEEKTAAEVQSTAPNKAAILAALAAFDSDDDERDDTYDAADVGGTIDSSNQEADGVTSGNEEALYREYMADEKTFSRDAQTRRGQPRAKLREETGMTDEAIEGWAVMLARNPQQKKRLEAKYAFSGEQTRVERTSWRDDSAGPGADDSDRASAGPSRGGGGRGGRGRGRGRGGRGGNVAGATGDKETGSARKNKEANKGSRANHNRRDARAKKMSRGGLPG